MTDTKQMAKDELAILLSTLQEARTLMNEALQMNAVAIEAVEALQSAKPTK